MKKLNYQDVSIIQKKTGYDGFFTMNQYVLQHSLFKGGQTGKLTRECFERGHAVGVLAYDPWQDKIVLLEQFRIGAYININERLNEGKGHSQNPWLLEIIAGIVESGESQEDVAYREAKEEAGLKLLSLQTIGDFYCSPGGTSETIQLYCACVHSDGIGGIHGLEEEGEDILVRVVSFDDAVQLLEKGEMNNASAMIAMQWLILHRNPLRDKWRKAYT